jgi:hypothetical protein
MPGLPVDVETVLRTFWNEVVNCDEKLALEFNCFSTEENFLLGIKLRGLQSQVERNSPNILL